MKVKGKRTGPNPNKSHPGVPRWPPYNQRALKVLIVGCGRVGAQAASDMDRTGHEAVIIHSDPNQFSRAAVRGVCSNDVKGTQVVADGTDADVLRRAGVADADSFVP